MSTSHQQPAFTHQPSRWEDGPVAEDTSPRLERAPTDLADLLPASCRTPEDDLTFPAQHSVLACVDAELDLRRLTEIHDWLWIAGRPMPPRPLHRQRLLHRELIITERLDHHLVWGNGRIFIKPLPRFLLESRFWSEHLHCGPSPCPSESAEGRRCAYRGRRERALGFLFSYAALIAYESDFHIAKESHLLPQEMQWYEWRAVVREILDREHIYSSIDLRFHYGELRLSRLNRIYFLWKTPLRGYISRWHQYGTFFGDNLAWFAGSTVYIVVVLTAMQVGLATRLQENKAFQSASYFFTAFSILGPLAAAGFIMIVFFYIFVGNWLATWRYRQRRTKIIKSSD